MQGFSSDVMDYFPRIYLIDDNCSRRASIVHVLTRHGIYAQPFESTQELGQRFPVDGLFLVADNAETIEDLRSRMVRRRFRLPIITYDEDPAPQEVVEALDRGAIDYLVWRGEGETFVEDLRNATSRSQVSPRASPKAGEVGGLLKLLTQREAEVLAAAERGLSNREIAGLLGISTRTVDIYRSNIICKLEVRSISQAVKLMQAFVGVRDRDHFMQAEADERTLELAHGQGGGSGRSKPGPRLTRREIEVLSLVSRGLSTKTIAGQMKLSERTVNVHRSNILMKLKAENATQAVRYAIDARMI